MREIIELSAAFVECLISVWFLSKFFGSRFAGKKKNICFWIAVILMVLLAFIKDYYVLSDNLFLPINITVLFLYSFLCLYGNCLIKISMCIFLYVVMAMISIIVPTIVSNIAGITVQSMISNFNVIRLLTLMLTKVSYFYIILIILKLHKKVSTNFTKLQLFIIIVMQIISLTVMVLTIEGINYNRNNEELGHILIVGSNIGIILSNVLLFFLLNSINLNNAEKSKNMLLTQKNIYQQSYINTIMQNHSQLRKIKHDIKNNFLILSVLLNENKVEEAKEYVSNFMEEKIDKLVYLVNTGNDVLDAMLSAKLAICKEKGIKIFCDVSKNMRDIPADDICTLLSNIIDNAIEASEKCEDKEIVLRIHRKENSLMICVKNRITSSVLETNPEMHTTKENKEAHGVGLRIVKDVVDKYNGWIKYEEENMMFVCKVVLIFEDAV